MNQISRTFILIGLVVAILLALHLLPTLYVGDTELRHVNVLSDILPEVYQQQDAIDVIPVPEAPKPVVAQKSRKDSTGVAEKPQTVATADDERGDSVAHQFDSGSLIADYSEGQAGGMAHFYERLATKGSGQPVRIAYYGDSFIEGDIVTCDLRELFQNDFGGSGVGWVDCADHLNGFRQTIRMKSRGMTEYEVVKKPYNNKVGGISQRYFVPRSGSSLWLSGTKARRHIANWDRATLYLRTEQGVDIASYANGDTIGLERMEGAETVQKLTVSQAGMSSVGFELSDVGPQTYLYGVALESASGVILDNFSMRGSAGFTLSSIPMQTLHEFARLRPYDLIVLHFGLNVASDKSHAANYKAYIKRMESVVQHLRQAYPQASILIMSMPDRDQRTDAGIRTMKGVESLVAYQQILAANCHVAYFNLFQAMGGRESMKALVDKGLASKDYTHLTFKGGQRIARHIYDGLMEGYKNY